eukprot:TRINITY_DN7385_c0_g4_i1.p2 TRINITY_DN7385_c0_g4~~TRINITY_DN7385_c0_g4_i1.p2  ORF type:complete len:149 (+),score=65.94 TRINITY_DN7385_c0_g4_i1:3-449(+)
MGLVEPMVSAESSGALLYEPPDDEDGTSMEHQLPHPLVAKFGLGPGDILAIDDLRQSVELRIELFQRDRPRPLETADGADAEREDDPGFVIEMTPGTAKKDATAAEDSANPESRKRARSSQDNAEGDSDSDSDIVCVEEPPSSKQRTE